MRIVFTSYISSPEFNEPLAWLRRIDGYIGVLEAMAKHHHVIAIERINFEGNLEKNGVEYHFVRLSGKRSYFPWKMHQLIKSLQPDIVFINGLIFPLQVIQLRMHLGSRIKIVAQNHAEKPATGLKKWLQQKADKYIKKYFFTARQMGMDWVDKGVIESEEKIVEVMEASSSFRRMSREQAAAKTGAKGAPVFLWVGRLDENKDPFTVLSAFLQFAIQQPAARLYMIFHTEELLSEIKSMLTEHSNRDVVHLVGSLPHERLEAWYNSADYIISGSHYEGSGIAICEAMSCGCVPIVTNIASFQKMTGFGQCGFLYKPGDSTALLKVLLHTQKIDLESEKEKVVKQFSKELSFDSIATKMAESFQNI